MLATSSLSAFSAALGQTRATRLVAAPTAQPLRAMAGRSEARSSAAPSAAGSSAPQQILPRGSLLDISA